MDESKYNGKYRIASTRAWWHNYAGGTYFVTICTKNREHYFGEIENGVMIKTKIGDYLEEQIVITAKMRADMNVEIPLFVVMPNHVHLIVMIGRNPYNTDYCDDEGRRIQCVSTAKTGNAFSPQLKNLASIIRGVKGATASFAKDNGFEFGWQSRFHDHVIRNIDELNRIALYIEHNVSNWKGDRFRG